MVKTTIADLQSLKGVRKVVATTAFDTWTAAAAQEAGVDLIVAWANTLEDTKFVVSQVRKGAPDVVIGTGLPIDIAYNSQEDALRCAAELREAGSDVMYCSALVPDKFEGLCKQHYPCCGHCGYLPVNDTWFGGPRGVGKTPSEAIKLWDDIIALEKAGCYAIELECAPARFGELITSRTKMSIISMGSGNLDGQYVFAEDLFGSNPGHVPRHAVVYGDMYKDAVRHLTSYKDDVLSGKYPTEEHCIKIPDGEFDKFMEHLSSHPVVPPPSTAFKPKGQKLTIWDLKALKGKRKLVVTTAFDYWTAKAAEEAGADLILGWGSDLNSTQYVVREVRRGAPNTLIGSGLPHPAFCSQRDALATAGALRNVGVDVFYCSGLVPDKFEGLCKQHYPCTGHVGYLPVNNEWFGGPRAVGKTAAEAIKVFEDVKALEAAGCIAIEMECVPARVAAEITKRTNMIIISMGSGPDCDGQFLFAEDVLGSNNGKVPRHAKVYGNFYKDAVGYFNKYKEAVLNQAYPEKKHEIKMSDEAYEALYVWCFPGQ